MEILIYSLTRDIGISRKRFLVSGGRFLGYNLFGSVGSIGSRLSTKYVDYIVFSNVEDDRTVNR